MIEKRKVVMENPGHGHYAIDYVPLTITNRNGEEVNFIDRYVADAKTRFQAVTVIGDSHDPGPGGDDGHTHYPDHLVDHENEIAVCGVCKE